MRDPIKLAFAASAALGLVTTFASPPARADWDHSILVVPSGLESTTWCGAASARIAMTGYPPATACPLPSQSDVAAGITANKTEAFWDADPAGMRWVLEDCGGNWPVFARSTRPELMFKVARYMGLFDYPVPIVVGTAATASHNHDEHWVLITAIRTDVDPTTTPAPASVSLIGVWIVDPGDTVSSSTPSMIYKNSATWDAFLQPVTKAASTYNTKFVAVIEPPAATGVAVSVGELVLSGTVISVERALAAARQAIERHRLAENDAFKDLLAREPLTPILVNREQAGYYLIPYPEEGDTAGMAVLINAYTGDLLEAGTFEPTRLLSAQGAQDLALRHLEKERPGTIVTEAVFLNEAGHRGRYSPTWKVQVDGELVGVSQSGVIVPRMTNEIYAITPGTQRLAGIAAMRDRLWVTDGATGEILEVLPATGGVLSRMDLKIERPKGLAFDGTRLWVADEKAMRIHAVDPEEGEVIRSIPLQVPEEKGFGSVEAIAWDGQYLWTAIAAGFSSSLNQVDPEDGRIVRSLFADCDPRGVSSDGSRLWTLCFNGKNHPPTVDERQLLPADEDFLRSRRFFKRAEGQSPSGLTFDGEFLWYSDAERNRAVRFTTPDGE